MEQALVFTRKQACEALQISAPTLRRAIKKGLIPVLHLGTRKAVIPANGLQKYLDNIAAGCQTAGNK